MRYTLVGLMVILFVYVLMIVLRNGAEIPVDLVFFEVPAMRVGLLLVIAVALGVLLGLLLGVQVFRVFQNRWEIQRLKRDISALRKQQIDMASSSAAAAAQVKEKTVVEVLEPNDESKTIEKTID